MRQFKLFASAAVLAVAGVSNASTMRITEYMYQGGSGEFIEFTNLSAAPIDLTGWSFDDDSRVPGSTILSAFGVVQPGESVILCEPSAASFISAWSLTGVNVIGNNTQNLGRNDEINLYDASNTLVDRLTYGDQNFPGTIRTLNVSGWTGPANLGANNIAAWQLSTIGDAQGSVSSVHGDIANPGRYIPEPASIALLLVGAMSLRRR